jgi:hypothetical protein
MKLLVSLMLLSCFFLRATPAAGQDKPKAVSRVQMNNVSFEFSPEIATNVNIVANPGQPPGTPRPDGATLRRLEFLLYNDDTGSGLYQVDHRILVYRVSDFAGYDVGSCSVYDQLAALQQLLTERPALNDYEVAGRERRLPHLPIIVQSQVLRARVEYLETEALTGIRYLTAFTLDMGRPLVTREFVYAFLGLSHDGQLLITGSFRVAPRGFFTTWPPDPAEENAIWVRYGGVAGFEAAYGEYVAEQIAPLNDAAPSTFAPSLDAVDQLIVSIRIGERYGVGGNLPP